MRMSLRVHATLLALLTAWPQAQAAKILYVAKLSDADFATSDQPLINRLSDQGHVVTVANDGTASATTATATGQDAVLISATAATVSTTFQTLAKPLLCWRAEAFGTLRLTGTVSGTNFGTQAGQTQINITNGAHALAAGRSGLTPVVGSAVAFSWGIPSTSAIKIATLSGDAIKSTYFGYETGAAMASGTFAPARRVGFFAHKTAPAAFNADGLALFDAAVAWLVGPAPGLPRVAVRLPRESAGPCTRRSELAITEIHYNPAARADLRNLEFVEIHNASPISADLSGYTLGGEIQYTFPTNSILAGFARVVVAKVPGDVQAVYGITGVLGPYAGNLSNGGGLVTLSHVNGAVLLEAEYDDDDPWPAAADGAGHSLVLARPSYGERGDPRAWEASTWINGSPGQHDPEPVDPLDDLVLNEVLTHTDPPQEDFVELYNHGTNTLNLAGVQIADNLTSNRFVIPPATVLGPGQYLAYTQTQLGFSLGAAGEAAYIWNAATNRVLDAITFGAAENGVSFGRVPDAAPAFTATAAPTPGAANAGRKEREVIFHEIMFNPISQNNDDEFVELFNRGTSIVALANWQFTSGITFTFPPGASIDPGGYAVVTPNRARFLSRYPAVNPTLVYGDYGGSLANSGERLALARPDDPLFPTLNLVMMDELTYRDGGDWGQWSDGGGSSLELVDPRADRRLGVAWADSDETAKASWFTVTATGLLDNGFSGAPAANELGIIALGEGEWLVDNVSVRKSTDAPGVNRLVDSTFETASTNWVFRGNHITSARHLTEGADGSAASLRVVATSDGDNGANLVESDLSPALANGDTATISARVRWLKGSTNLLFRLYGNYLEAVGELPLPTDLGTPGAPNSRAAANQGPAITEVRHTPVLPTAGQKIEIRARVSDLDGVASVVVKYRVEPSTNLLTVALLDSGTGVDLAAGDGVYSGTLPAQVAGAMVAFAVEATDGHAAPLAARFPRPATRECLVRVGEAAFHANLKTTRLWLTSANLSAWIARSKLSNALIDCTVVHGDQRVIYNAGARYRGSPFIRPGYSAPNAGTPNLVFEVGKDDRLLNSTSFNIDGLEPGKDNTAQRERMTFWLLEKLGGLFSYQRYTHLIVQGTRNGTVYADVQAPNGDYLESWHPGADDGDFYEIDDWFEFNDTPAMVGNVNATLQNFTSGGLKKKARYRWNWQKKSYDRDGDSAQGIFSLVDTMNTPAGSYVATVQQNVDVDNWWIDIGVRRIVGDWDGYGYERGKNTYLYRPPNGKWQLLPWDMDFSLGGGSRATNANLFAGINDPTLNSFFNTAPFRRAYWTLLKEACDGPLSAAAFNPRSDELYSVLSSSGLGATITAPSAVQDWVVARRDYILSQLATVAAPFAITTNGGADFSTGASPVTLAGTAPVEAAEITLNGFPLAATWTTVTNWQVSVALQPGANVLNLGGQDRHGMAVPGVSDTITVTYTGGTIPLAGNVKITEIHYHPSEYPPHAEDDLEFIELKNTGTATVNLSGAAFQGITYVFPPASTLDPGQHLVLAGSSSAFQARYPWATPFAEYAGQISNAGEVVTLLDSSSNVVTSVSYDDAAPWPVAPDGAGPSLVPVNPDPALPQSDPAAWRASTANGGSPGEDDPEPIPAAPVIVVQPQDVTGTVGQAATFLCRVSGYPAPSFSWTRDGQPVAGADWMVLTTAPAVVTDQGAQFQLTAANGLGTATTRIATLHLPTSGTPATPGTTLGDGADSLAIVTEVGVIYRIQYSAILESPAWLNLGPAFVGDGSTVDIPLPPSGVNRRYYRVAAYAP